MTQSLCPKNLLAWPCFLAAAPLPFPVRHFDHDSDDDSPFASVL
jgi:hypothetical protein